MFSFLFSAAVIILVLYFIIVIFGSFAIAIVFAMGVVGLVETHDPIYIIPAVIGLGLTLAVMS